jgi:hypothetical protein
MTASIRDRILARADLAQARADRDITTLAAALNAENLTASASRFITGRTILAECADGENIIAALEGASAGSIAVRWMLGFLSKDSGMDIGHPRTLEKVDGLIAAQIWTSAQGAQVTALSLVAVVVAQEQVATEMYNPDGTEK